MRLRRRVLARVQTYTRTLALAWFWIRQGYGLRKAWKKAQVTL